MPKLPPGEFYEALKARVGQIVAESTTANTFAGRQPSEDPKAVGEQLHQQTRMLGIIATALIDLAQTENARVTSANRAIDEGIMAMAGGAARTDLHTITAPGVPTNNVITCEACGNPYSTVSFDRCPGCKAPVPKLSNKCPQCGVTFNPLLAKCPGCGTANPEVKPKEGG